jgi:hypothetical protein
MTKPNPSGNTVHTQWYRMACRVTVIWVIAYFSFSLSTTDSNLHWLDRLFGAAPMLIVGLSFKSRWEGMSRPKKDDVAKYTRGNHDKMEFQRKLSVLWTPKTIAVEVVFFCIVAMQCVAAPFAAPSFDWIQLATNVTASFMMLVVWRYIRKANRTAARLIQEEIDKLEVKA